MIGRPHGVRGLVRVTSYTADPADLAAYGPLTDAQGRRFVLRWRGEGLAELSELAGDTPVKVADRTAAEKLTNTRLYIDRAQLPEPEDDEFYFADLIGLAARDAAGNPLGRVAEVHDYGAGASLEIARDGAAPLLVPFTRACVPDIDLPAGHLTVVPPAEVNAPDGSESERPGRRPRRHLVPCGDAGCGADRAWRRGGQPAPHPIPPCRGEPGRRGERPDPSVERRAPERPGMTWRASVLTLFPDMFPGPLGLSLAGRAMANGVWSLQATNIRDFATDRHRTVDDTPFGGGAGMVLRPDVVDAALAAVLDGRPAVLPDAPWPPLHPGRRAALRRRPRPGAAVRPLRGHGPAGDRGARPGGTLPGRLRAVGRRTCRAWWCWTPRCACCPA